MRYRVEFLSRHGEWIAYEPVVTVEEAQRWIDEAKKLGGRLGTNIQYRIVEVPA